MSQPVRMGQAHVDGHVRQIRRLRRLVADVRAQVALSLFTDFENFTTFNPAPIHEKYVNVMLDQVIAWGGALKTLRTE